MNSSFKHTLFTIGYLSNIGPISSMFQSVHFPINQQFAEVKSLIVVECDIVYRADREPISG